MLVGLWYVIETNTYGYLILSFFVFLFTGLIGINVCYHRLLSHKSYQTNLIIEKMEERFHFSGKIEKVFYINK
jgi:fatty-acid desaturase